MFKNPGEELGSDDILLYTVGLGGQVLLSYSVIQFRSCSYLWCAVHTLFLGRLP